MALGHLHRAQQVGGPTRRYSGTPLPYSFSETHAKQVVIVDIDPGGACVVTDTSHVVDAKARLRDRFPHIIEVVLSPVHAAGHAPEQIASAARSQLSPLAAAEAFWTDVTEWAPDALERELLEVVLVEAAAEEAGS